MLRDVQICLNVGKAVSGQERTVSKETFLNRKIVRSFVEENAAYQVLNQETCKGDKILSCRLRTCLRLAS